MKKSKLPKSNRKDKKSNKKKYKIKNWHEYNEELVNRGSLDFWVEQGMIKSWTITVVDETGKIIRRKRGAQRKYSDHAIETVLMIGKVFHQRLRQAEGFARSVFNQANVSLEIPDYTTLSRRGENVVVPMPKQAKERLVAILDSTGLKVFGEGEWKVRKHGVSKRRTWIKMHLFVDADGEIRVAMATDPSVDDAKAGIDLLKMEEQPIEKTIDDGAYDKGKFYQICQKKHISQVVVPPRKGARIWKHGNHKSDRHPRDENLRAVRKSSKKQWKIVSGYHARSRVENTMFRYKTVLGDRISARNSKTQQTEVLIGCKILNLMWQNGRPQSYAVT